MKTKPTYNYIKAHRKRWNIHQKELAFLLGYGNNVTVSNIEQGKQYPSLSDLIAFELLFEKAASRLFPDIYQAISDTLLRRLNLFEQQLNEEPQTQSNQEKLKIVRRVIESVRQDNENRQ